MIYRLAVSQAVPLLSRTISHPRPSSVQLRRHARKSWLAMLRHERGEVVPVLGVREAESRDLMSVAYSQSTGQLQQIVRTCVIRNMYNADAR